MVFNVNTNAQAAFRFTALLVECFVILADSFANSTTDRNAALTAAESGNVFAKSGSSTSFCL
jgi:hypothetical protein